MNRLDVEDLNHAEMDIMDTGGEVWGVSDGITSHRLRTRIHCKAYIGRVDFAL